MPDATASRFTRLRPAELARWRETHPGALVLDSRDAHAYAQGHLDGSLRLDGRNHELLLLRERKTRPVLVYCYHGNASQTYATMFCDFGFTEVADVVGGWAAITQATGAAIPPDLAAWLQAEGFDPAQPDAPGRHGNTPLMHAAWRGAAGPVEALLGLGVSLEAVNHDGNNALWLACVNGAPEQIRRLVAAGVPIDHPNLTGATALMYAASSGKAEVVRTLLALGADPHLSTQDGFSALDMAASLDCLRLLRGATRTPRPTGGAVAA